MATFTESKQTLWCNYRGANLGSSLISQERVEAVVGNFLRKSCLQTPMISPRLASPDIGTHAKPLRGLAMKLTVPQFLP